MKTTTAVEDFYTAPLCRKTGGSWQKYMITLLRNINIDMLSANVNTMMHTMYCDIEVS